MNTQTVLEVRGLTKNYEDARAVEGVGFSVQAGEVVGLLGPNGAGKTTTISMILGVLEPTAGSVLIDGINVQSDRQEALGRTNFSAVYAQLPWNLTVYENLYIFCLLYGVQNARERVRELLREFELGKFADINCGRLSSGEQTRVHLAKAMSNKPRILLLDEPTASLDPSAARIIREKVRAWTATGAGGVLWTSHNMHEVETVCDRVLFLSRGKILLEGDPKTLPRTYGKENLEELFITIAREPLSLELE
ncbi:MAG: ABC transporter ATP-binding protein [bacterium]|nr:ABC transporter ATP-binding protein [bacterium]